MLMKLTEGNAEEIEGRTFFIIDMILQGVGQTIGNIGKGIGKVGQNLGNMIG